MRSKGKWVGLLAIVIALVIGLFLLGLKNDKPRVRKKRKSPMYMGLPVKTIKSDSVLTSNTKKIVLPPVLQGDMVEHVITVKNWMTGPLQLKNVKSCCGYMLKDYSRQIAENETGKIMLLAITDNYGGKTIKGSLTAKTNDKKLPGLKVDVELDVKKFVDISQFTINLAGTKKDSLTGSAIISPLEQYPFKIIELKPKKGYFFDYTYKPLIKGGKTEYLITVKNKINKPVIYRDVLFIRTDHPDRPELKIRVNGNITD